MMRPVCIVSNRSHESRVKSPQCCKWHLIGVAPTSNSEKKQDCFGFELFPTSWTILVIVGLHHLEGLIKHQDIHGIKLRAVMEFLSTDQHAPPTLCELVPTPRHHVLKLHGKTSNNFG